jgi:FlaG/FlaF family flagellin (archaellin)
MKANRVFLNKVDEQAVSAVIGVILMVAITVAIAATVYVYVSVIIGTGPTTTPSVSMLQTGATVQITAIINGPIKKWIPIPTLGNKCEISINVINKTSGKPEGRSLKTNLTNVTGNTGGYLQAGDIILFDQTDLSHFKVHDQFFIQIIYQGKIIGQCIYTRP